jgi:hypothetical protein
MGTANPTAVLDNTFVTKEHGPSDVRKGRVSTSSFGLTVRQRLPSRSENQQAVAIGAGAHRPGGRGGSRRCGRSFHRTIATVAAIAAVARIAVFAQQAVQAEAMAAAATRSAGLALRSARFALGRIAAAIAMQVAPEPVQQRFAARRRARFALRRRAALARLAALRCARPRLTLRCARLAAVVMQLGQLDALQHAQQLVAAAARIARAATRSTRLTLRRTHRGALRRTRLAAVATPMQLQPP